MGPTTWDSTASLSELLHARALATAPRRLWIDLAGGAVAAATASWFRPIGWVAITSAGLCFAMYALWAVSERQLEGEPTRSGGRRGLWRGLRAVTTMFGLLTFVALLLSLLGLTLGTWIS
jgi:hypothetical protein